MLRPGISLKRRSGDVEKTPLQRRLRKREFIFKSTSSGTGVQRCRINSSMTVRITL